jgi:hypothetical protein
MAERVDAAVKAVKALRSDALSNPRIADAEAAQLLTGDDAVLPPREGTQPDLHRGLGGFWVHLNP